MKKTINQGIASEANILIAVLVWIGGFLFLYLGMWLNGVDNKVMMIGSLIASGIFAFGDYDRVAILKNKMLLFRGAETGYRANPGFYFTFWFWSLDTKEEQTTEKLDVIIPTFNCQDNNRKALHAEANGDYEIVNPENFKKYDASKMDANLVSLVKRTTMKETARLPYQSKDGGQQILGEEIGAIVLQNTVFKEECAKYGIEFRNLIIDAIAADLEQENINSYYRELYDEELTKYPTGTNLTHEQQESIEARIQVKLNRARRIITNSALLGRYDIDN